MVWGQREWMERMVKIVVCRGAGGCVGRRTWEKVWVEDGGFKVRTRSEGWKGQRMLERNSDGDSSVGKVVDDLVGASEDIVSVEEWLWEDGDGG
jgi:hypothetical protein